jgi:hypothetical protein
MVDLQCFQIAATKANWDTIELVTETLIGIRDKNRRKLRIMHQKCVLIEEDTAMTRYINISIFSYQYEIGL